MKLLLSALLPAALLAGCAFPQARLPPAINKGAAGLQTSSDAPAEDAAAQDTRRMSVTNAPAPEGYASVIPAGPVGNSGPGASDNITVNVEQMSIKAFAQFIFANLLKKTVALDARIEQRTDVITLRTDNPQSARQIADTAKLLLQAYGVSVNEFESLVRVSSADNRGNELPLLRRGRASADTPTALRPVFHLVELEATRSTEVIGWVKLMFGQRLDFQEDTSRNAILVSGAPEAVTSALEIIRALDQPRMRGRISKRINPAYLSSAELVPRLAELLTAQGYAVAGQAPGQPSVQSGAAAIVLIPVTTLNTVFVFTATQAVAEHVVKWAAEIDQPPPSTVGAGFFSFPVRYSEAQLLAKTMTDLIAAAPAAAGAAAQPISGVLQRPAPRVVVNAASNSLIIQGGSTEEHRQWRALLNELDKPIKSALIDVVVAEVTLGAKEQLGIEWSGVGRVDGNTITGGTLGGLGIGTGGLSLAFLNRAGDLRGLLNFLGSSSDSKVLSSPKLLTRNAETATIQVGQEVPIVTSQQSSGIVTSPTNAQSGILQTIQYRSTGVILKVKPVILAGGRLDLEVAQEVSSAAETRTGVSTSPTIATRKVETKLSLRDGGTVMIAGLISNSSSGGNTGIPVLKDIPVVGALFRAENKSNDKTELVILITAHILNDDFETEAITDSFRRSLSQWLGPAVPDEARMLGLPPALRGSGGAGSVVPAPASSSNPAGANVVPRPAIVPTQADPAVLEAPRNVRPGQPNSLGAPASQPATQNAAPSAQPAEAPAAGRLVTDPKLLEELNRALKK